LTLSGGGDFNNSGNLTLNNAASVLKLDGIAKIEKVSVAVNLSDGFLDVNQNVTIQTFSQPKSSRIDIADGKSLTLTDAFEVPADQTMELHGDGGGTLIISNNLTLSGILKLNALNNTLDNGKLVFNNGLLDVDEDSTISSDIFLADNASMDLATDKMLTVKESFEIPQILKLEMVGEGGGILNLDNTLKLTGTLQFSAPDYTLENGTLELNDGSLLDVDYHTIIDSDIVLLGNTTVDVAQGVSLEYRGDAIDLLNYQLTFLGSGTFLNTNAILLSNSGSLLILAGDITIVLIEVTGNSAAGKGIRVESGGAKVVNLNFSATDPDLANMGLTFGDDTYSLEVENLNVNSTAQITGDGNGGWLNVNLLCAGARDGDVGNFPPGGSCIENNNVLTLQDINVKVEEAINIDFDGQIVMIGNTNFDAVGGLSFNLTGAMNFSGSVTANINLNGGKMCIADNTTIIGNIRHFADSLIFIVCQSKYSAIFIQG